MRLDLFNLIFERSCQKDYNSSEPMQDFKFPAQVPVDLVHYALKFTNQLVSFENDG